MRVFKRTTCQTKAYKQALIDLAGDMGYSTLARVPAHMRVALRSHADNLAKVRCSIKRTGQPYPRARRR